LRLRIEKTAKKLCRSDERSWGTGVCPFKGEEFEIVGLSSRDDAIKDICNMMGVSAVFCVILEDFYNHFISKQF